MRRLQLFPDSTTIENGTLAIAGHSLNALADAYETPLYVYDRHTLEQAVGAYKHELTASYSGPASITYAGKAYLCTAIADWASGAGLFLDCSSEGELAIAAHAGFPRERLIAHGVGKSDAYLRAALRSAGTVVVDDLGELARLAHSAPPRHACPPELWLRLQPGATAGAHAYTQTGQHGSKFGMPVEDLPEAARYAPQVGLQVTGLHFHLGSQFRDPAPLAGAIRQALDCAAQVGLGERWHFSPGGGWGVAYHEDELPHPPLSQYVAAVVEGVQAGCAQRGLSIPHLHLEPGRTVVARAGVAVYGVTGVKTVAGRTWLLVDGGLADNPRPALYQARYSCLPVSQPGREAQGAVHIAGPFCESGDVLIEDLPMPAVRPGERLAIPVSGAYQLSMAGNYNGARRPAVVWLEHGRQVLIQHRETLDDLFRRDERLPA